MSTSPFLAQSVDRAAGGHTPRGVHLSPVDEEFKQWILDFPEKQLPRVYHLLQQYKEGKEIHIFKTREEADKYLDE